jgi:hypothetical protein
MTNGHSNGLSNGQANGLAAMSATSDGQQSSEIRGRSGTFTRSKQMPQTVA